MTRVKKPKISPFCTLMASVLVVMSASAHAETWEFRKYVPALKGGAAPDARLEVSPQAPQFDATLLGQSAPSVVLTLRNSGRLNLAIKSIETSAPFGVTAQPCLLTLSSGAQCQVTLTALPTAAGLSTGTLRVQTSAGISSIQLKVSGLSPGFDIAPSQVSFPATQVGEAPAQKTVTVTNTGNTTVSAPSLTVAPGFVSDTSACNESLAAGESCQYTLTFSPTAEKSYSTLMGFQSGGLTQSLSVIAEGKNPALSLSSTSVILDSVPVNSTSAVKSVLLLNVGVGPLRMTSATTNGPFTATHNCALQLAPDADCVFSISFTPTVAGAQPGALTLETNAGTRTVSLQGTGLQGVLELSPLSIDLGGVAVGSSTAARALTVRNTGNWELSGLGFTPEGPFSVSGSTCATALNPGQSCTVSVVYGATASGAQGGGVRVASSLGNQSVSLTGTGLLAVLEASPLTLDFGSVAVGSGSTSKALTLSNTGNTTLTGLALTTSGPYSLSSSTCSGTLGAGQSCTANVTYTATASGLQPGTVDVASSAGSKSVSLSGTGLLAILDVSPAAWDFGSVAVGASAAGKALTIQNTGNTPMTGLTLAPSGPYSLSGSTCGATLDAGQSCTVTVGYTATAAGPQPGSVQVGSSSGTRNVSLSGAGLLAVLDVSPLTWDFGSVAVGSSSAGKILTVSNTGNTAMTGLAVTPSGPYNLSGSNCGTSLGAGQSCSVIVTYTSTAAGQQPGSVQVSGSAGSKTVSLSGTGLQAVLNVTPASMAFGSVQVGASSTAQTVTVSNSGNTSLSSLSLTAPSPFSISGSTCSASLAAGQSCTANVTFTPVAGGPASADLTVSSSVGTKKTSLGGTGVAPSTSVSATTLSYANTDINTNSAAQNVTLTNNGTIAVSITAPTVPTNWTYTTTCGSSLAVGANCSYSITFRPTTAGLKSGASFVINNSGGNKTVSVSGRGTQLVYGIVNESGMLTLSAPAGTTFLQVVFGSYGTPGGTGPNYTIGSCHASAVSAATSAYIGKATGGLQADNGIFGDPCYNTPKQLAVTLRAG